MTKIEQGVSTTHEAIQQALKSAVPTDLKKTIIRTFVVPLAKEASMEQQLHQLVMQEYFKRLAKNHHKNSRPHGHKRTRQSFLDQHCLQDELYHLLRLFFINLFYHSYGDNYSYYRTSQYNYFFYSPLRLFINILRKIIFTMGYSSRPCQNYYFKF